MKSTSKTIEWNSVIKGNEPFSEGTIDEVLKAFLFLLQIASEQKICQEKHVPEIEMLEYNACQECNLEMAASKTGET